MKNTLLIVAGIVIVYLLFVNKKVGERVRGIAQGIIPTGLTSTLPNPGASQASQSLPTSNQTGVPVVINSGGSADLGADFSDGLNVSGSFTLPS